MHAKRLTLTQLAYYIFTYGVDPPAAPEKSANESLWSPLHTEFALPAGIETFTHKYKIVSNCILTHNIIQNKIIYLLEIGACHEDFQHFSNNFGYISEKILGKICYEK